MLKITPKLNIKSSNIFSHRIQQRRYYAKNEVTFKLPSLYDSFSDGDFLEWTKKENELLNEDDIVAKIDTNKVVSDIRVPTSGTLLKHHVKPGDKVVVGQDLFTYTTEKIPGAISGATTTAKAESPPDSTQKPQTSGTTQSSPEQIRSTQGTSKPTPEKIEPTPPPPRPQPSSTGSSLPSSSGTQSSSSSGEGERRVPMNKMRKTISMRLKESQNTAAMLTTFNEIDMYNLTNLRNEVKESFQKKHGVKLGFMSAFVKASTFALLDQPVVNAVIEGENIVYRDYVDISVAVASPKGLVVPVLRNCQDMSFAQIEKAIESYGEKAKNGTLTMDDMQGGTFTISNGGVFGSMMGTPIINLPQSAILGMHAIKKRANVVNDKIEIRPMMYVALTYDHRLIDGREAVTFLVKIKDLIENPARMLLE